MVKQSDAVQFFWFAWVALVFAVSAQDVEIVHIVFSNHLDIGFDGVSPFLGTDDAVINVYFDAYFPKAAEVAAALEARGGRERLVWTTQAYLVSLYLDCPPGMNLHCPDEKALEVFDAAVRAGAITWHAFPHNAQMEIMDRRMIEAGVEMTQDVDRRFGLQPKITLSQRDVPGMTRNAIMPLNYNGVAALSVGVNSGSAPPAVPFYRPFIWHDPPTNASLVAWWHPGGYSGRPVDSRDECVKTPGFNRALCHAWKGDNQGPPSVEEVLDVFARVAAAFPSAQLLASPFDDFTRPLLEALPSLDLPVVTAEIGDTWIHGVASDPFKLAEFRALMRMNRAASWDYQEPAVKNFTRLLLKVPEHTWGVDIKEGLGDYQHWNNSQLQSRLQLHELHHWATVYSWMRQRHYVDWALEALQGHENGLSMRAELDSMRNIQAPMPEAMDGYQPVNNWSQLVFRSHSWKIQISNVTGSVVGLQRLSLDGSPAINWAAPESPLVQLQYSAYREADFSIFWEEYAYQGSRLWWYPKDFGKPGVDTYAHTRREDAVTTLQEVWADTTGPGLSLALRLALPDWTLSDYGGCQSLWVNLTSPSDSAWLYLDVTCANKTPTRLPEAMWLRFRPPPSLVDSSSWRMMKVGRPISPLEVLLNGSHSLHAVSDEGVHVSSRRGPLAHGGPPSQVLHIRSLDAALVSPGEPTPFPNLHTQPALEQGMAFNLWNNIWGTNYVMWLPYKEGDTNLRFRFIIQVDEPFTMRAAAKPNAKPSHTTS